MRLITDLSAFGRDKFLEFVGRDPHESGAPKDIYHLSSRALPQFRFEWHPKKRIVYLILIGREGEGAQAIAHHAETHGHAWNYVNTFCRGYRMRDAERSILPALKE